MKNRKNRVLILFTFAFYLYFVFELVSCLFITQYDSMIAKKEAYAFKDFNKKTDISVLTRVLFSKKLTPDKDLGFDNKHELSANSSSEHSPANSRKFASAYGESFINGYQIPFEKTWQSLTRQNITKDILNFGVNGYGTDQAYLKFLKYYKKYPTDVVILGFLTKIIPRLITTIEDFDSIYSKPRFTVDKNDIRLFEADFPKDLDPDIWFKNNSAVSQILKKDGAYRYLIDYCGIDLLHKRKFPYILELKNIIKSRINSYKDQIHTFEAYMTKKEKVDLIIKHIIDEFIKKSEELDFKPVFLVNCINRELHEKYGLNFDDHIDYMKSRQVITIEARKLFRHALDKTGIKSEELYLKESGHYSSQGNLIISKAMSNVLQALIQKQDYKRIFKDIDKLTLTAHKDDLIREKVM